MSTYNVKYSHNKVGSRSRSTNSFIVTAESDLVALEIAKGKAQSKHPGEEVVILEVKKR